MSHFPLYDQLKTSSTYTDTIFTREQKIDIVDRIKQLDEHQHELIYAIIRTYQVLQDDVDTFQLPYTGKRFKSGIRFSLDKLPDNLQRMIASFLDMIDKTTG